jgi:hypothetical protein
LEITIFSEKSKGKQTMANSKLLKEAIADAKAVKETAIANAKIALEEAFTPRLQSILSKKLQAEMAEDDNDEADVNEEYGADDTTDADATKIGDGDNKEPQGISTDAHTELGDTDKETAEPGKEDENMPLAEGDDQDANEDGVIDDPTGASVTEEAESKDDDDFDLEEIIRELEQELDGKNEPVTEEGEEEKGEAKFESEKPEYVEEDEKPEAVKEEDKAEPVSEDDEEIDLDEILREMGYGDDEEVKEGEEEKMEEGADEEKAELQADLEEAYKVIKSLKSTINEVNLLNAKLLYTNKLFRSYDLTNEQKHKVVETLDRTQNVREVKLVFATLAESMKIGGTAKKVKQQKITESFASKKVASTAPKAAIINESNAMAERFKKLANIK